MPRGMVEQVRAVAGAHRLLPAEFIAQAADAWQAAGTPAVPVPAAVATACACRHPFVEAALLGFYSATAWWLTVHGETPVGEDVGRA